MINAEFFFQQSLENFPCPSPFVGTAIAHLLKLYGQSMTKVAWVHRLYIGYARNSTCIQNRCDTLWYTPSWMSNIKPKVKAKQGLLSQHQFCIRL